MTLKSELGGIDPEVAGKVPEAALDKLRSMVEDNYAAHIQESATYLRQYPGVFALAIALEEDFAKNATDSEAAENMSLGAKAMVLCIIELAESAELPPIE